MHVVQLKVRRPCNILFPIFATHTQNEKMQPILATDWSLFIGRFHPLVVHLPIGLLLLAAVLEWAPKDRFATAARLGWITGGISAALAVGCGWLLAGEGGYGAGLGWHRWLGVLTMVMGLGGVYFIRRFPDLRRWYGLATLLLVTVTGHLGGKLTHGERYLWEHAPAFVQKIAGVDPNRDTGPDLSLADPDSVGLYATFIRPVLDQKCVQCHNADKTNGGLRFDSLHYIREGGDGGPLFVAGNALESEWLRRVTLPRSHAKAMPPKGDPLTYTEIRLLAWWIDQGADPDTCIGALVVPEDIKALLQRDYQFETRKRPYVERLQLAPVDPAALEQLKAAGWAVQPVARNSGALKLGISPGKLLSEGAFGLLEPVAKNIVWVDLEGAEISNEQLSILGKMPNLVQLRLQKSTVTDEGIRQLVGLKRLESLNVYETRITDAALPYLEGLLTLQRLYLWQTQTTEAGVAALRAKRPGLDVDMGTQLVVEAAEKNE